MKTRLNYGVLVAFAFATSVWAALPPVQPVFTYQGRLVNNDIPADGLHDFEFRLLDGPGGGAMQIGSVICRDDVDVTNGLFTVDLDFGPTAIDGQERFLEVSVRADATPANCAMGAYTPLSPRQRLTPSPHAIFATSANTLHSSDGSLLNAVIVDAMGNVGINEPMPLARLHVAGADNNGTNATLRVQSGAQVLLLDGNEIDSLDAGGLFLNNNVASNVVVAQGGGSMGIGTNTPEASLHIFAGSAGVVTANANSNAVIEDSANNYLSLLTPDANESGVLFGSPVNSANGGIVFNNILTPDGLQFRAGGNQTRMTLSSLGNLGLDGSLSMVSGQAIIANGQLTIGGNNLVLRLGDSAIDQVVVPARELFMADTTTPTDGDQSLFFTDGAVSTANFLRWDDITTYACGGAIGNLTSAFDFHITDNSDSGWVFSNGANSSDAELRIDELGNVQADGSIVTLNACDLAEAFLGPDGLPPGTVVVLDAARPEGVTMSSQAYQGGIVGAVSTVPAFLMSGPTADAYPLIEQLRAAKVAVSMTDNERALSEELEALTTSGEDTVDTSIRRSEIRAALQQERAAQAPAEALVSDLEAQFDNWRRGNVHVALVGRVPVRVTGPVHAGDHLTASDIPGVAMAMQQPGPTLGVALQGYSGSGEGAVVALIQPGWFGGVPSTRARDVSMSELLRENAELKARMSELERRVEALVERAAP